MRHVTETAGHGSRERLLALRDRAPEARYTCLTCRDNGLIYVRTRHPGVLAALPCPMCEAGARRHLHGNVCIWARGHRPCPLCGALEGEQVPGGFVPRLPAGFVPYDALGGRVEPQAAPGECPF